MIDVYGRRHTATVRYRTWDNAAQRGLTMVSTGEVDVVLDIDKIVSQLARQALRNDTGKARAMNGLITATVVTRNVTEEN
jgi:hypothetical protein